MAGRRFDRTGWAMAQEGLTCPQKCVLIILADAADEVRGVCWLKHATIAERTSLSLTATKAAIRALVSLELVRVADRNDKRGRQTSNYYQLGYYEPEDEIDWRGAGDDSLRTDEGGGRRHHGGAGDDPSIVNRPEGLNQQEIRKKTSSSPSRTRRRSSSDPEPDQSRLTSINREMRPGMEPQPVEETPRVRRQRKHQEEHIHAPLRRNAEGLACYWGVELEKVGSLEASEEAIVRKYFKAWLDKGLSVKMGRQMVDAFFADLELADSTQRWKRFVANAELLRQRVVSGMDEVSTTDVKPFAWIDALPPALRKAALSGEDVA